MPAPFKKLDSYQKGPCYVSHMNITRLAIAKLFALHANSINTWMSY